MSPLLRGNDKSIISENIRELRRTGRSEAQSVAIAMHKAKGKKAMKAPKPKPVNDDDDPGDHEFR